MIDLVTLIWGLVLASLLILAVAWWQRPHTSPRPRQRRRTVGDDGVAASGFVPGAEGGVRD